MNRWSARRLAPALALAAAACSNSLGGEVIGWRAPTSLAVFLGRTHIKPGETIPYLAVAGSRGDELRLLDPSDDLVVPSPGFAFGLVIPTLQRPLHVAAGPMGDGGPDALVVAGPGTLVQLVSTWEDGTKYGSTQTVGPRVVADIDLAAEAGPGATILSLIGTPVPGAPQGSPPVAPYVPGRARVLVGISGGNDGLGGKLVVLEFARNPDEARSLSLADKVVKPLGFDPVSMALSPDNFHVYSATRDVITDTVGGRQVLGVAEMDTSPGLLAPWPVRGLDARAPTTLVAAAFVGERLADPDSFGPPVPRVYAALDPTGCGPDAAISCGVATLDPTLDTASTPWQLAADFAPATGTVPVQGYRAPMQVPGVQLAMAVAMPPLTGPQQTMSNVPSGYGGFPQPLMNFAVTTTGARWGTGALVVGTAQGGSFVFDIGRGSAPDETFLLTNPDTRTKVSTATSSPPPGSASGAAQIGILSPSGNVAVKDVDLVRLGVFTVWPGFTNSDSWILTWQGTLPNLVARRALIVHPSGGPPYLAIQQAENASTPTSPPWIPGADVYDPRLGVHADDFVGFVLDPGIDLTNVDPCTGILVKERQEIHQVAVADILTPTSAAPVPAGQIDQLLAPGGALLLKPASVAPPACPVGNECQKDWVCQAGVCVQSCQTTADCRAGFTCQVDQCVAYSDPFCFVPDGASVAGFASVVSGGYVLTGSAGGYGYAGRPQKDVEYSLQWDVEEPLLAQCPLLQKPPPNPLPACDQACRDSCERLVLARKARRFYYPQEGCPTALACSGFPGMTDPLSPGPVIRFTPKVYDPNSLGLGTGATVRFNTQSGLVPMQRVPSVLSAPTSAISLDKSQFPGREGDGTVFYVTYLGDTVFELLPGISANAMVTIR